ncbi:MAG TPA: GAF domain-containing sensor histidine kinase [Aggregatilineales bacterium]|nr:GAF domain-containing sensor histidine kinase [Aggregatilineales bacterium]
MTTPHIYTILVVGGDYALVNCIRQALPKNRFQLHFAYTHRDASFIVESQGFDGVIIDSRLVDRYTGQWTLDYIYQKYPDYHYVAYVPDETQVSHIVKTVPIVFTQLDPRKVMRLIADVFSLPEGLGDTVSLLPKDTTLDQHLARKIEEVNTLFALSRSLTQSLDLGQVLNRVIESAQYLTVADEAIILLAEEDGLYLRAKIDDNTHLAHTLNLPTQDKVALEVNKTGQAILVNEKNYKKYDLPKSHSALYVPIILRDAVSGVLGVKNIKEDVAFNDNQLHLLTNLATFAAIAIENARVHQHLEQSLKSLKAAQTRLVHTARLSAMGELASVVAHQMNNPLTTIIAETELILADEPANSPKRGSLQAIARTGRRAANVARRLLAIARPVDINAAPDFIDVVDSLRGVLSLLQPHIEHRGIQLIVEMPRQRVPPIRAVKGQLEDIWLNLLMNAYDALFGHNGAKIGVQVRHIPEDSLVEIIVWDNGPGIPPDIQEKIFSPFFTTKPIGEGTGLGLHICREVVGNLGGTIRVESIPYERTQFIIYLLTENRISSISDDKEA